MDDAAAWKIPPEEVEDEAWRAQRELASAIRELGARCIESRADTDVLRRARELVERATAQLSEAPALPVAAKTIHDAYVEEPLRFVDQGAMLGRTNPAAGPLRLRREGERVVGEVRLGALHAGAPGLVHGGILATLMDEVLGHAAIVTGVTVVTATLKVRYHRPTPIATPLRCEGWIQEQSGRRFRTRGHILAEGERTVSAEGVFVDVGGRPFSELLAGS